MNSKGLLIASFLLLALSGVIWWSNKKASSSSKPPVENATTKLLSIPQDQIQEVEIKKRAGETIHLQRKDSKWQITAPNPLRADQDAVSSMLSTLSSLNSERLIEEKAPSLEPYGLSQPLIEVEVTEKNKKIEKLLIGDDTPAGSAAYAAVAGDPRVFTVASYNKNSLDKSSNDLRDKRLLAFDSDKISRVELVAKKQDIEFGRNKDQWQILKPKPLRADGFQVDDLVRTLGDAKMDLGGNVDEKKAAANFSSGTLIATVKVTDVSGTQELQVRKSKDDYYARSSTVEGVYKVSSAVGTALDKKLDDFRNKKLFDFAYVDPGKIELHDGAKSYFLTHGGADWWSNGVKMDESSVRTLVDKIRDLSASKFIDEGFGAPVLDVTVTSNEGKRSEKVLVSKNGDKFVAKRVNEPALYELEASAVTDLQKSAAEVKPSTPPKK